MTIYSWPLEVPSKVTLDVTGGPEDIRASFQPDVGPSIDRLRTTAASATFSASFGAMTFGRLNAFETWFRETLRFGTRVFVMVDPMNGGAALWKFQAGNGQAYTLAMVNNQARRVSATLMRMPGRPWYLDYVAVPASVPPDFVADFQAEIYGLDDGTLQRITYAAAVTTNGTASVSSQGNGLVLNGLDSGVSVDVDASWPAEGTWVVDVEVADVVLFPGSQAYVEAAGAGAVVVAYDGNVTLIYGAGALVDVREGWAPSGAVQIASNAKAGYSRIHSIRHYGRFLPDWACRALALGEGITVTANDGSGTDAAVAQSDDGTGTGGATYNVSYGEQ